jgi:hypothetical protein
MSTVLSPLFLFPPVSWWQAVVPYAEVQLHISEPFRKMTFRSRYQVATANGQLLLSVPVAGDRTQHMPMGEVLIDNRQDWCKQHWRTLFSAYGRAPFFEYYGTGLDQLFQRQDKQLATFNLAALAWIKTALTLETSFSCAQRYAPATDPDLTRLTFAEGERSPRYPQVFEDRHGFLPNLSILDLLMNEGPAAKALLMRAGV